MAGVPACCLLEHRVTTLPLRLGTAFGRLIHEKTEGNPLSMVDRLRDLRDRGEETIAMARRQRQPVSLAFALCLAQLVYILRQERDRLLEISGAAPSTEAHAIASGVYGRFTEGFDAKDLRDAAALAAALERGEAPA